MTNDRLGGKAGLYRVLPKAGAAHGAGAAIRRADLPERTVIILIVYNDLYYTRNGMLVYMETGRLRKMKQ